MCTGRTKTAARRSTCARAGATRRPRRRWSPLWCRPTPTSAWSHTGGKQRRPLRASSAIAARRRSSGRARPRTPRGRCPRTLCSSPSRSRPWLEAGRRRRTRLETSRSSTGEEGQVAQPQPRGPRQARGCQPKRPRARPAPRSHRRCRRRASRPFRRICVQRWRWSRARFAQPPPLPVGRGLRARLRRRAVRPPPTVPPCTKWPR
mmetsp:Transcript_4762/g.12256  ORF Transcript_4762/g.12256 Transcript_4762/m.12256 type:complete len:205 (+) Transcript_4762:916-1530(+)